MSKIPVDIEALSLNILAMYKELDRIAFCIIIIIIIIIIVIRVEA